MAQVITRTYIYIARLTNIAEIIPTHHSSSFCDMYMTHPPLPMMEDAGEGDSHLVGA